MLEHWQGLEENEKNDKRLKDSASFISNDILSHVIKLSLI